MATPNPLSSSNLASGPGTKTVDVSTEKHPTNLLSIVVRAIRADGEGTLLFHAVDDPADTIRTVTLAAGEKFDLCYVDRVLDTSTASGLLGVV